MILKLPSAAYLTDMLERSSYELRNIYFTLFVLMNHLSPIFPGKSSALMYLFMCYGKNFFKSDLVMGFTFLRTRYQLF